MNNYELVLQIPYVKFALAADGFKLLKNKYEAKCKLCSCKLTVDTYVLWKPDYGIKCAADCVVLTMPKEKLEGEK
jgi:hypothetical protein